MSPFGLGRASVPDAMAFHRNALHQRTLQSAQLEPVEKNPVSGLVADALDLASANPISRASRPASTALRKACAIRLGSEAMAIAVLTNTASAPISIASA